jgi:hypothetical protein
MKTYRYQPAILSALLLLTAGACVPPDRGSGADMGMVIADLQLAPMLSLNTATFSITGPNWFARSGSIDVSHSNTISVAVGGIPAGDGYSIAITGTATDGQTTCSGSGMFSITAGMSTALMLRIQCREPPRTGNVSITGDRQRLSGRRRYGRQSGGGDGRILDRAQRSGA